MFIFVRIHLSLYLYLYSYLYLYFYICICICIYIFEFTFTLAFTAAPLDPALCSLAGAHSSVGQGLELVARNQRKTLILNISGRLLA